MNLEKIKKLNIPKSPGCYKFLDKNKKIIYVGKAVCLKSRVSSYWQKKTNHSPAKYSMLKKICYIEWIKTDSEIEALLLEANLIKKHQPRYNVVMRDDKRYIYIKISSEEKWPKISITRQIEKTGRYFGPFTSTEAVRESLKTIRKIWPYRSCYSMPKKACLYYRIKKCSAPCENKINEKDYKKIINQIILFLEGKKNKIIDKIKKEIKNKKNEEDKKFLRYKLINLNKILEHTNILSLSDKYAADIIELAKILNLPKIPKKIEGYDIANLFGKEAVGSMVSFLNGEPEKKEYRKFKIKKEQGKADDVGMLSEILERRFKKEWPLPDLIIIDGGKAQLNATLKIIKKEKKDITAIAISKGNGLRSASAPDKIFFKGEKKPLELPLSSPALHVIKRVRDEAHRFAINYHKNLRRKKFTQNLKIYA